MHETDSEDCAFAEPRLRARRLPERPMYGGREVYSPGWTPSYMWNQPRRGLDKDVWRPDYLSNPEARREQQQLWYDQNQFADGAGIMPRGVSGEDPYLYDYENPYNRPEFGM